MTHLVVISRADAGELDDRIVGLSQWMGVPTTKLVIDDRNGLERLNALLQQEQVNIAISEAALASLRRCTPAETLRDFIESRCARLLVYRAGHPMPDHSPLPWLTHEMVRGASNPTLHASFRLPDAARHFSGALAGQTFDLKEPVALSTFKFAAADQDGRVDILLAGDAPVLTRMMCGVCELFLLSLARLPDVRQQLPADEEAHDYFDALLPILIFLRHGFADLFWRGSGGTAHLIIDDPLLVDRYGFLDYTALCHSMRAAGYESTIAFIPWNHWRTSRKAADSFRGEASLSICVHGCDHTNREFSDVDPHSLQWKADTAMTRMEDHEHRTGLPFDRIMVFPQGHFSSSALSALRTAGYLAAVNTTVFPTDAAGEAITLGDLMRPAVAKQHGFPVFQRRSPRSIVDFAFDAFLGRPMLVVQHHEDFRDGFRHLEDLARKMHSLDPTIRRGALSDGLMRSCIARAPTPGAMDVHFYTRRFRFTNPHPHRVVVSFSKDEPSPSRVANVFAGGVDVAFSTDGQRLTFGRVLEANERIEIEIQDRARSDRLAGAPSWAHTTRVVARRALSEFRDNSLSRHPRLLTRAKNVARRLSLTGSSEG